MDVREDTTLRDGDARQELVQFLVVTDRQLKMSRYDSGLLVVAGSVSGQLENFGGEIFHDGGEVDGSAGTDTFGVISLPQQSVYTTDWKLKTGTVRTGLCLSLHFAAFTASRHADDKI